MSKEIYISKFGYLTPKELNDKLLSLAREKDDIVMSIGQVTIALEKLKSEAIKMDELLREMSQAKTRFEKENLKDESHR